MVMAHEGVHGRFVWEGLRSADRAAAEAFYTKIAGWRGEPWAVNPAYTQFTGKGGTPVAGVAPLPEGARPGWMSFIGTDDVDATVSRAESLGAKVVQAASDINGAGRIAVLTDPQGAGFGLMAPLQSPAPAGAPQHGSAAWHELSTTDPEAALKFYEELFGWQLLHKMDMG